MTVLPGRGVVADTGTANGGVPNNGANLLDGLTLDGASAWQVPYQDQAVIGPPPVASADGTIFYQYAAPGSSSGLFLYANRGGTQPWASVPLPVGGIALGGITVGADGNPYYLVADGTKPHGFAVRGTSAADGSQILDAGPALDLQGAGLGLQAYVGGVAHVDYKGAFWVQLDGTMSGKPTALSLAPPSGSRSFAGAINADGTAWQLFGPDLGTNCLSPAVVRKLTAVGVVAWEKVLPTGALGCDTASGGLGDNAIAATPDGGAVIRFVGASVTQLGPALVKVDTDGNVTKQTPITSSVPQGSVTSLFAPLVDANGHVAVPMNVVHYCTTLAAYRHGVEVHYYDATGAEVPGTLSVTACSNDFQFASSGFGLDAGRIYLGLSDLQTNAGMVDAFVAPITSSAYPSSALLPQATPVLSLTPAADSRPINSTHVEFATLTRNGAPVSGATINFSVTSGPCVGKAASLTTDNIGTAAWGYSCGVAGTDTITATISLQDGAGGSVPASASASVTWTAPNSYVALGDSFSSGEGAPGPQGYVDGTDVSGVNKCHRSDRAYSNIDAHLTGMPPNYSSHACSGAIIEDFFSPFPQNHPGQNLLNPTETHAQLDWLNGSTSVVTLTLGGNDALFPDVMGYCAARAFWMPSCQATYGTAVDQAIATMATSSGGRGFRDDLPDLYSAIRVKAPNAKVYVLGYPRFFPTNRRSACATGAPYKFFTGADMQWINTKILDFDHLLATTATAQGFTFVPMYNSFDGHELCTLQPYLNSVTPFNLQGSFHPNVKGQARIAQILARYLP